MANLINLGNPVNPLTRRTRPLGLAGYAQKNRAEAEGYMPGEIGTYVRGFDGAFAPASGELLQDPDNAGAYYPVAGLNGVYVFKNKNEQQPTTPGSAEQIRQIQEDNNRSGTVAIRYHDSTGFTRVGSKGFFQGLGRLDPIDRAIAQSGARLQFGNIPDAALQYVIANGVLPAGLTGADLAASPAVAQFVTPLKRKQGQLALASAVAQNPKRYTGQAPGAALNTMGIDQSMSRQEIFDAFDRYTVPKGLTLAANSAGPTHAAFTRDGRRVRGATSGAKRSRTGAYTQTDVLCAPNTSADINTGMTAGHRSRKSRKSTKGADRRTLSCAPWDWSKTPTNLAALTTNSSIGARFQPNNIAGIQDPQRAAAAMNFFLQGPGVDGRPTVNDAYAQVYSGAKNASTLGLHEQRINRFKQRINGDLVRKPIDFK